MYTCLRCALSHVHSFEVCIVTCTLVWGVRCYVYTRLRCALLRVHSFEVFVTICTLVWGVCYCVHSFQVWVVTCTLVWGVHHHMCTCLRFALSCVNSMGSCDTESCGFRSVTHGQQLNIRLWYHLYWALVLGVCCKIVWIQISRDNFTL